MWIVRIGAGPRLQGLEQLMNARQKTEASTGTALVALKEVVHCIFHLL